MQIGISNFILTETGVIAFWTTIIILHNTAEDTLIISKQLADCWTSYTSSGCITSSIVGIASVSTTPSSGVTSIPTAHISTAICSVTPGPITAAGITSRSICVASGGVAPTGITPAGIHVTATITIATTPSPVG